MKKYFLGIFSLILAIGMSAYTAPKHTMLITYDWVSASDQNDTFTGTRDEAVAHYGCDQGSDICAEAFEQGTQTRVTSEDLKLNP
jgi:hypothetical protein